MTSYVMHVPLEESGSTFNLEQVVCSHGFFMMSPNQWDPSNKTFQRPLRLLTTTDSITVQISQEHSLLRVLILPTNCIILPQDQEFLLGQVRRMLRISNEEEMKIRKFHSIHPEAKHKQFGRILRSPTLFEDLVKIVLLCNTSWGRSLDMAKALCELEWELKTGFTGKDLSFRKGGLKRKHTMNNTKNNGNMGSPQRRKIGTGNFPSSKDLANLEEGNLRERCRLGFRAKAILELARKIESGKLELEKVEEGEDCEAIYKKMMNIKGFGHFSCSYVLTCLGFYHKIPADTETIRHIEQIHARKGCSKKTVKNNVEEIYDKFEPFQFLAYWYEVWGFYEEKLGKMSELDPTSYKMVTGSILTNNNRNECKIIADE